MSRNRRIKFLSFFFHYFYQSFISFCIVGYKNKKIKIDKKIKNCNNGKSDDEELLRNFEYKFCLEILNQDEIIRQIITVKINKYIKLI